MDMFWMNRKRLIIAIATGIILIVTLSIVLVLSTRGGTNIDDDSDNDRYIMSVVMVSQPKTMYTAGERLDLNNMVVGLQYHDEEQLELVSYSDFEDYGITTNIANGTTLSETDSGKTITAYYLDFSAHTDALDVASVPILNITVVFDTDGGSHVDTQIIEQGSRVSRPIDPTKDGFVFVYWQDEYGHQFAFDSILYIDITLKAIWDAIPSMDIFEVVFDTDGGSHVDTQIIEQGSKAIRPADPTKDGFVFDGWYNNKVGDNVFDFEQFIISDIVIYAHWEYEANDFPEYLDVESLEDGSYAVKIKSSDAILPEKLDIPSLYNNIPITKIADKGFASDIYSNMFNVVAIYIPFGVTHIGEHAFWDCSSLITVHIPQSVVSIGQGAFYNCNNLASITIPNSIATIKGDSFSTNASTRTYYMENNTPVDNWVGNWNIKGYALALGCEIDPQYGHLISFNTSDIERNRNDILQVPTSYFAKFLYFITADDSDVHIAIENIANYPNTVLLAVWEWY